MATLVRSDGGNAELRKTTLGHHEPLSLSPGQRLLSAKAEAIRMAPSAKVASELGRSRRTPIRPTWDDEKVSMMKEAVLKKFQTHENIRELLLSTGGESLIENAPSDYFWGCGKDGTGLNWLGKILEETRELLIHTIST